MKSKASMQVFSTRVFDLHSCPRVCIIHSLGLLQRSIVPVFLEFIGFLLITRSGSLSGWHSWGRKTPLGGILKHCSSFSSKKNSFIVQEKNTKENRDSFLSMNVIKIRLLFSSKFFDYGNINFRFSLIISV